MVASSNTNPETTLAVLPGSETDVQRVDMGRIINGREECHQALRFSMNQLVDQIVLSMRQPGGYASKTHGGSNGRDEDDIVTRNFNEYLEKATEIMRDTLTGVSTGGFSGA